MNEEFANIVDYEATDNRLNLLTTDTQWGTRFGQTDAPAARHGLRGRMSRWMSREREDNLMVIIALILFAASLAMVC